MVKIPTGTWILVADGTKARLFSNVGTATAPSLHQERLLEPVNLDDDGPAGRQPADADGYHLDEATFVKQLALAVNDAALNHRFEHLVLIADPQSLGQIRPLLHQEATRRTLLELPKTLTNSPLEDIERALAAEAAG